MITFVSNSATNENTPNLDEGESLDAFSAPEEVCANSSNDAINEQLYANGNSLIIIDPDLNPTYYSPTTIQLAESFELKTGNSWDSIDDLVKFHVEDKMPEKKIRLLLDFEKLPRSKLITYLALGCQSLLTKLDEIRLNYSDQSIYTSYQLELRRLENSSAYELYLRVDALEWYTLEQGKNKDIISNAKDYVERIINKGNEYEVSCGALPSERWNPPCYTKPKICDKCDFFVCNKHRIYTKNKDWYAAARCDGLPIITINPKKHQNNKRWIVTTEAWEIFWHVVSKLQHDLRLKTSPFARAFINFGYWMSQASKERDIKPEDCHAHINMVLTSEAINACKTGPAHLRILQCSTKCPTNYRLSGAIKLWERIDGDEMNEYEEPSTPDVDDYGIPI